MRNTGKLEDMRKGFGKCKALLLCPKMKRPMQEHEPLTVKF